MLVFKNILREFACCSLLCGDGIYTPGTSAAPHLRALYIAINYTVEVEWLSTGKLISHYPLSNIQRTAVNICISRKSSWLPLAGCRVSVRVRRVNSPPTPSQKAFDSHCHSFHSKTCDPSLVWSQFGPERCHQLAAHAVHIQHHNASFSYKMRNTLGRENSETAHKCTVTKSVEWMALWYELCPQQWQFLSHFLHDTSVPQDYFSTSQVSP